MRRANKILMAAVAILLCLVLITTSVISGVFARFAIVKKSETSISFQNFGVTVKLTPSSNLKTKSEVKKGDSASVMFEELQMAPGDEFYKALKVEIGGTPNVDIVITMKCHIDYNTSDYTVGGNYYMPLGYTIQVGEDGTRKDTCYPYKKNTTSDKLEEIIVRNSANELFNAGLVEGDLLIDDSSDYYYSKKFDAASAAHQKTFYLGFDFPDKGRNSKGETSINYDDIVTKLSEKYSPITIIFSFTIEQA